MSTKKKKTDNVRASRDGHEYHEIWVARKSLELLNPSSTLKAIAVEGLSPVDQELAANEEVEIADVALYYGGEDFHSSEKVSILQFKYSVAKKDTPIIMSDIKKTIEKFAKAYKNHLGRFDQDTSNKLSFQFITNRPVPSDFEKTVKNLAIGKKNTGEYLELEDKFKKATKLKEEEIKGFASICKFLSCTNLLSKSKSELENALISLSATSGIIASSRLGKLKELVREKAGTTGSGKNIIEFTDVLTALSIQEVNELLPCPESLSSWGNTLTREQTDDAIEAISNSNQTVLIHASGGVGKTVFMKSLADKFNENHEVVFFDSFGGGSYRSIEDARHLAKHGLIHIANTLAFRGLCDLILPNTPDDQALAKTFRRRLEQCLKTLRDSNLQQKIYIFIDAIDNAEFAAKQNKEQSFSKILLESFHNRSINGVKLIVSCRTERKPNTYARCDEFELKPFSKNETSVFLKARIENSSVFIDSAYSRSGGNARILEFLVQDKGHCNSKEGSKLQLDDLLTQKIEKSIDAATQRGSSKDDLTTFLSGLTLLAPPVSIEDYALANNVDSNAITSMVSDLAPLLEISKRGVMFKDEPTETLIIKKYGSKQNDLNKIASNLSAAQEQSVFAAKTLPSFLYKLGNGDDIYSLATDSRIPHSIESDLGKLEIRYARLKFAVRYAAGKKDFDKLIGFLVKISPVTEFDQRGLRYLLNSPEFIVELNDTDAIRRVYEAQTEWPGTRHARLGIIHILQGDLEEAHHHVHLLHYWVNHYLRMDQKTRFKSEERMEATDCAVRPLFSLAKKNPKDAAEYLSEWVDWYSFEVAIQLYRYLPLAKEKGIVGVEDISRFHGNLESIGALLAALFFYDLPK
ncbi:MAG: NACHT domain-containing protein, partial [Bacteriovoracales bacterium]|nr:NACHT domain-containing protein [Bacteriovoracales bacterium]